MRVDEVQPRPCAGISFLVIGRFWDNHRSFYRHIQTVDARLIGFNLLVLLRITLVPASAALLGSHLYEPIAVTLYAINVLLATVSLWLLCRPCRWRSSF